MERIICIKSYGRLVQVHWWIFHKMKNKCFISLKVIWSKWVCILFLRIQIVVEVMGIEFFFYICGFDILLILVFVVRGINKPGTKSANSTLQSSTKDPLSCSSHSTPGIVILLHQLLFPRLFIFSYVWLLRKSGKVAEKVQESWEWWIELYTCLC